MAKLSENSLSTPLRRVAFDMGYNFPLDTQVPSGLPLNLINAFKAGRFFRAYLEFGKPIFLEEYRNRIHAEGSC